MSGLSLTCTRSLCLIAKADGVSYLMAKDEASLFMQLPGGMIFEIIKAPDMGLA